MRRLVLSLLLTLLFVVIKSNTLPKDTSQQQTTEPVIYGVVPEDVQSLQPIIVTPAILSGDSSHEVCEYKLEPKDSGSSNSLPPNISVPFRVMLQDKKTGSALLLVSEGSQLDYEKINHYELELLTVFCDRSVPITRRQMSIRVTDVNEFAPEWKGQGYLVEVPEGRLFDTILKVEATDRDGSEQYSAICHYRVMTRGVPFAMDDKGYLRNTEPLNYKQRHNYILEVVAEDCGGLASNKAFVNILITERCQPGWKGLEKQMNYNFPSGGPSLLVHPNQASLQFCDLADNCTVEQVTVGLKLLKTNGTLRMDNSVPEAGSADTFATEVETTCDLDAGSVKRRLETCEPELNMIDLLNPEVLGGEAKVGGAPGSPMSFNGSSAYDIKTFKLVEDVYKDYLVQEKKINNVGDVAKGKGDGDGRKGVETIVMTRDGPNSELSISMWMKRDYTDAFPKSGQDEKQSILCNSDGEGMSRNHVALFLHNCHLVMLARFEPSGRHIKDVLKKFKKSGSSKSSDDEIDSSEEVTVRNEDDEFYRPSEWHWKLDQTCDNKWHHYAVNVDHNKARLFVDGNLFVNTPRNPVTLEDHALHLSKKVHSTKLTVGACWKGLTRSYGDHFRGHLAELRVLRRSQLKETTVKCISNCNEKLDFHSINEMESGMSISMNSQMTELTINGRTKASVEHLLSTVGYSNPRMNFNPAAGYSTSSPLTSTITFHTSLKCADEMYPRPISKESMEIHLVPSKGQPKAPLKTQDVGGRDSLPVGSSLFISGTQRLDYPERDISRGIPVFRDVDIYRYPPERDLSYEELIKENPRTKDIESCTVRVSPAMDEEVEDVTHPRSPPYNHLRVDSSLEGLIIKGPSKAKDFVEILKKINYIHKRPEDLNKKIFVLYCHDGEGKKSKDDLVVELNAIHFEYPDDLSQQAGHVGQNKFIHPVVNGPQKGDGLQVEKFSEAGSKEQSSRTGNASVVATITLCVCVLMVVISVGMYRVFFHRQKTVKVHVDNQQEPQWDRSTITITVNPLETAALKEEDQSEKENGDESAAMDPATEGYYDDDDDIGSAHEMMRDTEEEEEEEEGGGEKVQKGTKYSDEDASKINHFVMSDTE